MYDPIEARKSFLELLKERGAYASFQSIFLIIAWYMFNKFMAMPFISTPTLLVAYTIFLAYFTWKPKLIRFLRG